MNLLTLDRVARVAVLTFAIGTIAMAESPRKDAEARPLIMAHYMPWFEARPASAMWGWHWTMNGFNPETIVNGQRSIASHYFPLIGPYDSSDRHVIEYHLLLMKTAGIDGVIVDWYGLEDFRDYPMLHRNTEALVREVSRLGMKFVICYEDQTIPALVGAGRLPIENRISHAKGELQWIAKHWFNNEHYVRLNGRCVLLSFGQRGLTNDEWSAVLTQLDAPVAYFSQHHRRSSAVGAFDWPSPGRGLDAIEEFEREAKQWTHSIPVVFPRFVDIYEQASIHASFGRIDDDDGKTFRRTLDRALKTGQPMIQIATWNDWGEGTIVEPSKQFEFRDLEFLQQRIGAPASKSDLRLPHRLLVLRRESGKAGNKRLDAIADRIAAGQFARARQELTGFESSH